MMTVRNEAEAWSLVNRLFPGMELDEESKEKAGYNIYRHSASRTWVSDLGDRLEVNEWENEKGSE